MSNGVFITVEGIEGSGKSTLSPFIASYCETQTDYEVITTREPGGTPCAEAIRHIFLQDFDERIHVETEALLIYAARCQHLREKIIPHLERGGVVICDRFVDTTFAYQQGGGAVEEKFLLDLNDAIVGDTQPNLTFLLDVPVDLAFQRIEARLGKDRMEKKSMDFFERIRQAYLHLAEVDPMRIKIIDGSQPINVVQESAEQHLKQFFQDESVSL